MTKIVEDCLRAIVDMVEDVNNQEIASQIESDNLSQWCCIWRCEIRNRIANLIEVIENES